MYLIKMPGASMFVEAANGVLKDRILFGSSYPFIPVKEAVRYYSTVGFHDDVLPRVMGANALRLLRMD
jgi:hypothetical protein